MENKDIWVFIEQNGSLARVTREVLSEGRRLADKLGGKLSALLPGHRVDGLISEIANLGADTVYLIDNPKLSRYDTLVYCGVITQLIRQYSPKALLFGASLISRDLAPRLAALLKATLVTNCVLVETGENEELKLSKSAYSGKVWVTLHVSKEKMAIITVFPGIAEISKCKKEPSVLRLDNIMLPVTGVHHENIIRAGPEMVDVTEAQVVIAGGRGAGQEGFTSLKRIASILGASAGGTRVAVDNGWVPYERQIGQTGKTVSPYLFISVGASGAMHFTAGFKDSEFVIAIDKNPRAAIFDIADVGIVADLKELLPSLLSALSKTETPTTGDTEK